MATLTYRISRAIRRWHARRNGALRRFTMMNLRGDDDRPRGPGWFDSSWDLERGLDIRCAGPGEPGFGHWLDAMARPLAAVASPDDPHGNAIEFVDDDAGATCGHGTLADVATLREAVDAARLEPIEWCLTDTDPVGGAGTWLAAASVQDAFASSPTDVPLLGPGAPALAGAAGTTELSLVPI